MIAKPNDFSKVDEINFGIVIIFFNIYYPRACILVYKRVLRDFDFQNKSSVMEIIKRTIHKAALCMFLGLSVQDWGPVWSKMTI